MAQWKLIIEDDAGKTIVVPLSRDEITIGRKEGNTIRLTERNVSRGHAKLTKVNGTVSIEDLKSFNGIKINGDRINGQVNVREGDLIEIGDYHLALQAEGAQDPAQDPAPETAPPQAAAAASEPVGSQSGAVEYELPEASDDEFAGDTQRWEPPANMDPVPVGMPTLADGEALPADSTQQQFGGQASPSPPDDEVTIRNPAMAPAAVPSPTFSQLSDETEAMPASPSQEATIPHLASPPVSGSDTPTPITDIAPTPMPAVPAPTTPMAAVSGAEPSLPASAEPGLPSASHGHIGAKEEMTEQIRAAPGLKQDLSVPRLVVLNSMFAGSTYHVQGAQQVIGRTEDNDITIGHRSVSRNHAKIVRDGNFLAIHDMQSANGILVNDKEVDGFKLSSGDIIELGRIKVRFVPPGETFTLTSSEVEAARRKAALGEDDASPNASLQKSGGGSTVLVAVGMGAIILLLLAVVVFLLFKSGGKDEAKNDGPKTVLNSASSGTSAGKNGKNGAGAKPKKVDTEPKKVEPAESPKIDDPPPGEKTEVKVAVKRVEPKATPEKSRTRNVKPKKPRFDKAKAQEFFIQGTNAHIKGQTQKARDLLKRAIKNNPRHADAHRNLGIVYSRLGETNKAYQAYAKYLQLKPDAPDRKRVQNILDVFDKKRGR